MVKLFLRSLNHFYPNHQLPIGYPMGNKPAGLIDIVTFLVLALAVFKGNPQWIGDGCFFIYCPVSWRIGCIETICHYRNMAGRYCSGFRPMVAVIVFPVGFYCCSDPRKHDWETAGKNNRMGFLRLGK